MSHPWSDRLRRLAGGTCDAARLAAGRADLGRGSVGALRVQPGVVEARVETDDGPLAVRVVSPPPSDAEWRDVEAAVLARPTLELRIAGGELPVELAGAMADAGVPLVPGPEELDATCSCTSADDGCRHVAATLLAFADRVSAEPALLLSFRGRTVEALAGALRERGGMAHALAAAHAAPDEHERALPLDESFWTAWPVGEPPLGGDVDPGLVLDELGPPPPSAGGEEAALRLRELYAALGGDAPA